MATSNIDISIGLKGSEVKQLYQKIQIKGQFQKQNIRKKTEQLAQICGTAQAPFIVFQMPTNDFKQLQLPMFTGGKFESRQIQHQNKIYQYGTFKEAQLQKFNKNLEKFFKRLTQLNGNMFDMNFSFYNLTQKQDLNKSIWEGLKINGKIQLDKEFVNVFKQILQKVSPSFLNSPIIIFLELLEFIQLEADLQSIDENLESTIKYLINLMKNEETKVNEQTLRKLQSSKQNMTIYLSMGKLFHITICGPSNVFGALMQLN